MVDFKGIIERIKAITGYTQKEIASKIFGISDKNLSNKIRRGSIDLDILIKWAGNENVDLNWVLVGKGDPYLPAESKGDISHKGREAITEYLPKVIKEVSDSELIHQFRDKSYSKDLILCLAELEQLSPEAFKKVGPYIKGLLDGLRMASQNCLQYTGPERRIAERRVKDDPEGVKGVKDRRSEKNRRAAAQR